jgi:hypothetical protein
LLNLGGTTDFKFKFALSIELRAGFFLTFFQQADKLYQFNKLSKPVQKISLLVMPYYKSFKAIIYKNKS